jgi:hypothetical protein
MKLKAPFNKLMWEIERDETKILDSLRRGYAQREMFDWITRIFDYAFAFAWEEPKTFYVRDRDVPGHGWVCVWKIEDGRRIGVPLNYVKRPWEKS